MYTQNTCLFIPFHKDYHSIHTVNMVLETKPQPYRTLQSDSIYKMHIVCSGTGLLHTPGNKYPLSSGDIFFTFPGTPSCIESVESFTYMYISFLGSRGNMIMDKLKINTNQCLFHDCKELLPFWEQGIQTNPELTDLISESILLYTFTVLGNRMLAFRQDKTHRDDTVSLIKKYIDDHFSDIDFSLEEISRHLQYNQKYLSVVFKKKIGVGIITYLNTIRIQHACTMMQQGFTCVNDIAYRCGYNDPGYFSRIFKEHMGLTPTSYMNELTRPGSY